jgi:hypothetical protein
MNSPGHTTFTARLMQILIAGQLFLFSQANAQKIQSTPLIKFETQDSLTLVKIKFSAPSIIYSLLVIVTNQEGNTVFLDARHRFAGVYDKVISVPKSSKGNFVLSIISDEEKISRKISFK